jgi:XisI protein
MGSIDQYREIVRRLILDYAQYKPSHGDIATEAIIDPEHNHFELMHVGWDGPRRVHGAVIHIDIIADKIWIQHDGTSPGIADGLVEAGIPRDAIVLGFRPPRVRQYSGFASA